MTKNKQIRAIIFDLDGILVDTAKYHYIAWSQLAEGLGFSFSEADNERLKGVSRGESLEILLSISGVVLSKTQKHEAMEQKNHSYVAMIREMTPAGILPGALEFLQELRSRKIKTALGSASKNAAIILENTGLDSYLDFVVDGNATTKTKPDPEVFLLGARGLGELPQHCLVLEDAQVGIEAAQRGGMRSVGIGSTAQLGGAELVLASTAELSWEKIWQALC